MGSRLWPSFLAPFFGVMSTGASLTCLNFVENFGKCWVYTISNSLDYDSNCENATERALVGDFDDYTLTWTLCVSTVSIGGIFGALIFGLLSNKFGRKQLMTPICLLSIISTLLAASSYLASSVLLLQIGRFFIGMSCSAGVTIYPVYLSEIAPAKYLGNFGAGFTVGLTGGFIITSILGTEWIFSSYKLWAWIMLVSIFLSSLQLVCLFFAVESPVYLLRKNLVYEANIANKLLHGEEAELIDSTSEFVETNFSSDLKEIFTLQHIKIPTLHIITMYWSQNVTGIPAMMFFSNAIFQKAGIPPKFIGVASIAFFTVNLLSSFACGLVVDKLGRTRTYTISCVGMGVCLLLVFVLGFFGNQTIAYVTIAPIITYNAFSNIGLLPIPFMLAAELIPVKNRGTVQSMGVFNGFLSQFIVGTLFPILVQAIDQYVFLILAVFAFLAAVHIWFVNVSMEKAVVDSLFLKRRSSFIEYLF